MKKIIIISAIFLIFHSDMQCPPKKLPTREQLEKARHEFEQQADDACLGMSIVFGGLGGIMLCVISCIEHFNQPSSRFNVERNVPRDCKKMN